MKLSVKLTIILLAMLVVVLFIQSFTASRVIGDAVKQQDLKSTAELYTVLQGLKSYQSVEYTPFSRIVLEDDLPVQIIKSDKYEVFSSTYFKEELMSISREGETLIIKRKNEHRGGMSVAPIYVFMPEEPAEITVSNYYFFHCRIFGFEGKKMKLLVSGGLFRLYTNLSTVNISQKNTILHLYPTSQDTALQIPRMDLHIRLSNHSTLAFADNKTQQLNFDIQSDDSNFDIAVHGNSKIGNASISGTLYGKPNEYGVKPRLDNHSSFYYTAVCDSLHLDLTCQKGLAHTIELSENMQVLSEDVKLSENVWLRRE